MSGPLHLKMRCLRAQRRLERAGEQALIPRDAGHVHKRSAELDGIGEKIEGRHAIDATCRPAGTWHDGTHRMGTAPTARAVYRLQSMCAVATATATATAPRPAPPAPDGDAGRLALAL